MIQIVRGNLIESDAEALVNSVNTVGVMGKGIALQFKQAFPENFRQYAASCKRGEVQPGAMHIFETGGLTNPKYIINFPTKRHWRGNSRMSDIDAGLKSLVKAIRQLDIKSIAIPPLGCGNGGLRWSNVRPMIEEALADLPGVKVSLFEPAGSPEPHRMIFRTPRPKMTPGRAALLGVLSDYLMPGYRLALIELHKLAYFLQVAGEPLKLNFEKERYGPYAENLNHVLQQIDGHFIRGYGDRTNRATQIELDDEAVERAQAYLESKVETRQRLMRVSELIEGFETPYGLELLATVHWVATSENMFARTDVNQAIRGVHDWNKRKRETFKPNHITKAWERLSSQGWL